MKFSTKKSALLQALQQLQSVIEKRTPFPILASALFTIQQDKLSIMATDLEIGRKVSFPVHGRADGSIAIPLKTLVDFVKELDDEPITLTAKENNWVHLECGKLTSKIMAIDAQQFPMLPSFEDHQYEPIERAGLKDLILRTSFCVSTDTTKPQLNGICLHVNETRTTLSASDGHRISIASRDILSKNHPESIRMIIPEKGISELKKLLDNSQGELEIAFSKSFLFFNTDSTTMFIRTMEGEIPDYGTLQKSEVYKTIRINKACFSSALRRMLTITPDARKPVQFEIQNSALTLQVQSTDFGEAREEIEIISNGEKLDLNFNGKFILDYLTHMESSDVDMEFKAGNAAACLRETTDSANHFQYIFMPVSPY
jgi:DNA polymerase-3 subunit beta